MRLACIAFCIFCSCSRIQYKSENLLPVTVSFDRQLNEKGVAEGIKQFYLWGQVPKVHTVRLDEEMLDLGFQRVSNVRIEEYQTLESKFYAFISFGMYIPINYRLTAFGKKKER